MSWGQPGPAGQLLRTSKPTDVTDLSAIKMAATVGPIPLICWITRYPAVTAEPMGDHRPEHLDLTVISIDQLQQGKNALAIDHIQRRSP